MQDVAKIMEPLAGKLDNFPDTQQDSAATLPLEPPETSAKPAVNTPHEPVCPAQAAAAVAVTAGPSQPRQPTKCQPSQVVPTSSEPKPAEPAVQSSHAVERAEVPAHQHIEGIAPESSQVVERAV